MKRITKKDLELLVSMINNTAGTPQNPWYRDNHGYLRANIGNYHLDSAYGGWKIVQMISDGGGIREITYGFQSKRKVHEEGLAFCRGIAAGKQ